MGKIRTVFLGTPEIAKICLQNILFSENFEVVGVVTQPDRPRGRKMKLQPCAVKELALEKRIPVISPESVNTEEALEKIKKFNAELAIVVAFGQILGDALLAQFPNRIVNLHTSLLPRWRGAAPIQRAIMAGDKTTGVCLQLVVKKLDAGDVIASRSTVISDDKDALSLHDELAELGSEIITKDLVGFCAGEIKAKPQDESQITYAKKIEKSEAEINWHQSAREIFNRMRGLKLGPGSFSVLNGKKLKIHQAFPVDSIAGNPGEVVNINTDSFDIQCGDQSALRVSVVQPESKAKMSSGDFIRGYGLSKGDVFNG